MRTGRRESPRIFLMFILLIAVGVFLVSLRIGVWVDARTHRKRREQLRQRAWRGVRRGY